jgi:protease II
MSVCLPPSLSCHPWAARYGAYGSSKWPSFDPADLAVLDRGLVIAWAHVRGGGELGSAWHTGGQKFTKENTFHDFLAVAHHLVERRYTSHDKLAVWGRSAGDVIVPRDLQCMDVWG